MRIANSNKRAVATAGSTGQFSIGWQGPLRVSAFNKDRRDRNGRGPGAGVSVREISIRASDRRYQIVASKLGGARLGEKLAIEEAHPTRQ